MCYSAKDSLIAYSRVLGKERHSQKGYPQEFCIYIIIK